MKDLALPALENVMNHNIKLHPSKFKNTYRHWMENVKDWCISRQLWWGHRIPAYYINGTNDFVVAANDEEALKLAQQKTGNKSLSMANLKQDEDVLDTWCSAWLWPISVFDGIRNPNNPDITYYYPTDDLVTAPEILFFWVARMIIAGYEYRKDKPFKNVYLTGIVRDKLGRKMSKQLGNSPDPIKLMNQYGADGVRVGMLLCSPAGNDLPFDESLTEQGRNFGNKIWNAFRLVQSWKVDKSIPQPEASTMAVQWFDNILNKTIAGLDDQFTKYRISEALMSVYKLFWDEFSSWYLEIIKPGYQQPIDAKTLAATINFFDKLLKLLHPFMPFITEEIWHYLAERMDGESIMVTKLPKAEKINNQVIDWFEEVKNVITFIRNTRNENKISPKETIALWIKNDVDGYDYFDCVIEKLGNCKIERRVLENVGRVATYITNVAEYYIPLGNYINIEEEVQKLEDELKYTQGFRDSVNKKLANEKFMASAPQQIVQNELNKKVDAEAKIKALEEQLKILKG
jgi:valyl-tRNA synthetase